MSNTRHFFSWHPYNNNYYVRPKYMYAIYTCTPKQDEENPCLFHTGVGLSEMELSFNNMFSKPICFDQYAFELIVDSQAWRKTPEKCITVYSSPNFKVFCFFYFLQSLYLSTYGWISDPLTWTMQCACKTIILFYKGDLKLAFINSFFGWNWSFVYSNQWKLKVIWGKLVCS